LKRVDSDAAPPVPGPAKDDVNALLALLRAGQFDAVCERASVLVAEFPGAVAVHNILAAASASAGRLEQAAHAFRHVLSLKPSYADGHNNLGKVLTGLGQIEEALVQFERTVELNPAHVEAHCNRGNALMSLGRLEESGASFGEALRIDATSALAHTGQGKAFKRLGRLDEALHSFELALEHHPTSAEHVGNVAGVLRASGRLDEAIRQFTLALELSPGSAGAHNNLGNALREFGHIHEAAQHYRAAVLLKPSVAAYWQNLSIAVPRISFDAYTHEWADVLVGLLDKRTLARPSDLAGPALRLLRKHPEFANALRAAAIEKEADSFVSSCDALAGLPLFLRLIEVSPIADLEVEGLLRQLRLQLLLNVGFSDLSDAAIAFQVSLALHCFTNEFVYGESEQEARALEALENRASSVAARGGKVDASWIACIAGYKPLAICSWLSIDQLPHELGPLIARHIEEPARELELRSSIEQLKPIQRTVSLAVQRQYEENPYPRWVNTQVDTDPCSVRDLAERLSLEVEFDRIESTPAPTILVAGCGTGQHAVSCAGRFANSEVLAIDLSLSSLSYASRQSADLGVSNIQFVQADILDVALLGRQFDVIESSGVLHHMADPMAGWRSLKACLKPGGLMKVALYSEVARTQVVAARQAIEASRLSSSRLDVLRFRAEVLASSNPLFTDVVKWNDFFSTSELRDLLFHTQEHRFSLPRISECLNLLELSFVGFEFPDEGLNRRFAASHPVRGARYNLDKWHEFEMNNPDTFIGMYQLWLQNAK
jgi:tetratricopeptide (TPR) repeat protein/2-polyprenyl-3-methyl-5-hydroxy-6-metoxy-1,4-benzoquinol methylase